jgi:hypothetical protein
MSRNALRNNLWFLFFASLKAVFLRSDDANYVSTSRIWMFKWFLQCNHTICFYYSNLILSTFQNTGANQDIPLEVCFSGYEDHQNGTIRGLMKLSVKYPYQDVYERCLS